MNKPTDNVVTAQDRECQCFTGVVMDLPGEEKVTARTVAKWIREGRIVGRCAVEDLRSGSVIVGHTCEKRVTP